MSIQKRLYESRIRGLDEVKTRSLTNPMKPAGKTEFAVVATASGMLIKAFPKEEQARMYIKNKYSQRKNLRGNLGIVEVPKSRAPGNNMKKYGDIKVVKESVELDEAMKTSKGKIISYKDGPYTGEVILRGKIVRTETDLEFNELAKFIKSYATRGRKVNIKDNKGRTVHIESVELDEAESIHWNKMKKDERVSLLKDSGLPSSFAKDDWKGLDHRAKERMGKYVNKSTKGEYALRP